MKINIFSALVAASILAGIIPVSATSANPETAVETPGNTSFPLPTPTADQEIANLQKQLEIAKLKAAIAQASATPTPAATPTPQVVIAPVFNVTGEKNNSDNVTQQQQVVGNTLAAPVTQAVAPAVRPAGDLAPGVMPSDNEYLNWTFRVWEAISNHRSAFITNFTSGSINYFGRTHTSNGYIIADMMNDSRLYVRYHNNYNLGSFRHDVSDEYSSKWSGPMIYDSITVYSEVWGADGVYHHANVRFTVGYTLPDNRVYALVIKVL